VQEVLEAGLSKSLGKMPTVVVLLDTSASMNQRTSSNISLLDAAKAAIELMVRRFPNERAAKFMLVTTRNGGTVEVGWKDSQAVFIQRIKMTEARDYSDLGGALRCCYDLLAQERSSLDVDDYGQGRKPWECKEAAAIWVLTDGCELSNFSGIMTGVVVPQSDQPGGEVFLDPFRWDQRILLTLLRLPGYGSIPSDIPLGPVAEYAEKAGGKVYVVSNMRSMNSVIPAMFCNLYLPHNFF
jgi:hypothetical protein